MRRDVTPYVFPTERGMEKMKKLTFEQFIQVYRAYEDYIADGGRPEPQPEVKPEQQPEQQPEQKPEQQPEQEPEPKQEKDPRFAALEKRLNALEKRQSMIDVESIHPEGLDDVVKKFV